ncbi:hypothetical protein Rsub_09753 [Raphidocelis subcapitata]|uniref:beta-aspartyl-peptidase n=1 Tax=Raphidocelis subcapitata TaxID=307507 RepID=A0A2V0PKX2_9CHLO|nr:hypothetical protein Rsub_09753 [Raphidocelis subcapitata]|eukprot:GBF97695.1 hypothetical protein Rsub_09753 [Raphidocelis subcapitata]
MQSGPGGRPRWVLAIHGGAGVINTRDPEWVATTKAGLETALDAGIEVLEAGGSALDAVTAAVVALEEDPRFNAGRGSVLTLKGLHELEASVMTSDQRCGAAALLTNVRNPVLAARAVMERTPHILLAGPAAEALAAEAGLERVADNAWFTTEARRAQWEQHLAGEKAFGRGDDIVQRAGGGGSGGSGSSGGGGSGSSSSGGAAAAAAPDHAQTVGAVALDASGRLAAATSTGGRCAKLDGRIGDTPIIGAGNWADARVALSGTGIGEAFLRRAACHDVAARVAYGGAALGEAVAAVVHGEFRPGDGGFIGVGADGCVAMDFNSEGMSRAAADANGRREVAIFKD